MRRRKVPNVMGSSSSRGRVSDYNVRNDSMKDMKKFYGWSEQKLEQEVRGDASQASRQDIEKRYEQAYSQDKNK